MPDHLGEERVEGAVGSVAGVAKAICANAGAAGCFVGGEGAAGGAHHAVHADHLHVHSCLDRGPTRLRDPWVIESEGGDRIARGEADLGLDEVDTGHLLGHRVLDLEAGVGFDEDEGLGALSPRDVDEELEGPEVAVANAARESHRGLVDLRPELVGETGRRRYFDHLLVTPLDAAFALAEVRHLSPAVAKDLHLDMAGPLDELLDVDVVAPECRSRLGPAALVCSLDVVRLGDCAGAAPAAAGDRLDDHCAAGSE